MKRILTILSLSAILLFMSNSFAQDRFVASDAWGFGFGFTYPMYVGNQRSFFEHKRILWWIFINSEKFF